jgi:hypothetical protein
MIDSIRQITRRFHLITTLVFLLIGKLSSNVLEKNQFDLKICNPQISEHVDHLLQIPQSILIPYGRAYVAKNFGIALYIHRINDEILEESVPEYVTVSNHLELEIRSCKLPESFSNVVRGNELDACDISFYARMVIMATLFFSHPVNFLK